MTRNDLARRLVRLYPRAWRARYEDELVALIDAMPLGAPQLLDIARGCGDQWLRATVRTAFARVVLRLVIYTAAILAGNGLAAVFAFALDSLTGPPPAFVGPPVLVPLFLAVLARMAFLAVARARSESSADLLNRRVYTMSSKERVLLFALTLLMGAAMRWIGVETYGGRAFGVFDESFNFSAPLFLFLAQSIVEPRLTPVKSPRGDLA